MSLRVALVSSLDKGGPVEQSLMLAAQLREQGVEVRAVCGSERLVERFERRGVKGMAIPLRHPADLMNARRVWAATRDSDVVHAQDRRSGLWTCLGPRPQEGGVRVYTIHGLPEPFLPPPCRPPRSRLKGVLAYRGLDATVARRADLLVIPSQAVAGALRRIGYPHARMRVIPNGVELPPEPLDGTGSLVATVSVLEPVKALDVFVRAAAIVGGRHGESRFGVFGSGSDERRLARLRDELGMASSLTLFGHVPAREALEQLRIFVLCSYMENSPMALLEAMAAGVPAIATRVGGVPEIASADEVELIEPGDADELAEAIERLLADPELRRRRAQRARERVAGSFTASANARRTLEAYEEALARRTR